MGSEQEVEVVKGLDRGETAYGGCRLETTPPASGLLPWRCDESLARGGSTTASSGSDSSPRRMATTSLLRRLRAADRPLPSRLP